MRVDHKRWTVKSETSGHIIDRVAVRFAKMERMPRRLRQLLAVTLLLMISVLTLNGGALLAASFMHVIIGKVDMPPAIMYQTTTGALVGNSIPSTVQPKGHHVTSKSSSYTVIPRPALSHSLDHLIIALHNPADTYIQKDAVDIGVLIQQSVHQFFSALFFDATRTKPYQSPVPQGIPLTQGQ